MNRLSAYTLLIFASMNAEAEDAGRESCATVHDEVGLAFVFSARLNFAELRLDAEAILGCCDRPTSAASRRERQIVLERELVVVQICANRERRPAKLK